MANGNPSVLVVTGGGSQNVEISSPNMSVWDILSQIGRADPNMQIRFAESNGSTGRTLSASQARETYVGPGARITQTPKGVNAAKPKGKKNK